MKAALAAVAVVLTGPIGLLAIAVYYLRKQSEQTEDQRRINRRTSKIDRDLINLNRREFQ